jgi:uncharacterized YigZ family protein
MLFNDSYFTITANAQGLFKDRGSKFISYIFKIQNEKEVKERLTELKKEHPSANHHCYAWVLGAGKEAFRASDDGEPSGTAGKPILAQLKQHNLTNVLLIVVRYFGGTLLGTGGLINAYKEAAMDAIKNSHIEEKFILFEYRIEFGFEDLSSVMHLIKEFGGKISAQEYETTNAIVFSVKKNVSEKMEDAVKNLYKTKLKFISTL